jgi:radical SAM protein with 4Fe4S-binding SPASM domain
VQFELVFDERLRDVDEVAALCGRALRNGRLAGKNMTVTLFVRGIALARPPRPLEGHELGVRLELREGADPVRHVSALSRCGLDHLGRIAQALYPGEPGVSGQFVVRPAHAGFGGVVQALEEAGIRAIELDMDGAYVSRPDLDPQAMVQGLHEAAVYYAERLLKHQYFRLDPMAPLFWRIYNGTPQRRSDPAGAHELAVAADGAVYPALAFVGREDFRLGSLAAGELDQAAVKRFEDVGALTTSECIHCWARNLCGGGTAAVHLALSGSHRRPHAPWCEAQRNWMAMCVSAFNLLSSHGVNFSRTYANLDLARKPSLLTLARAAFRMNIGLRPIEEADAERLTKWENWNDAAYFTYREGGLMIATRYDREMDSLHPLGVEQEFLLLRKDGTPFGLLRVRPERLPGVAQAWIYMRGFEDYASDSIRKSFRFMLNEAAAQQNFRRIVVAVGPAEQPLAAFLESTGFRCEGTLREALFLHGAYHDVRLFGLTLDEA